MWVRSQRVRRWEGTDGRVMSFGGVRSESEEMYLKRFENI